MTGRRTAVGVGLSVAIGLAWAVALGSGDGAAASTGAPAGATATPIKHVVVIFDENVSFDHYFATYPHASNPTGEPAFTAAPGTPTPNNLASANLLAPNNPNSLQPQRIDRSQAVTCDHDHSYSGEQTAFDGGKMDKFSSGSAVSCADGTSVMDYFDGNTVTGMWSYAQHYELGDAFYGTTFGPSTPGALNLISGNTHGATLTPGGGVENGTVIGDPDPSGDVCGSAATSGGESMSGKNVGDLLTAKSVTWGWFQGGFRDCRASHSNVGGGASTDYSPHHEPFQYYASTANLQHTPPASVNEVGNAGPANHQYDLTDFNAALAAGNMPAVSFLKAPSYQDGHAGYSDPVDEQTFLATEIDAIEKSQYWPSTAIVIAYDDSDGWYDHAYLPPVNPSAAASDSLSGPGMCGSGTPMGGYQDRCGHGPRLPLLVISPYVHANVISHATLDQTSITRFIEDNWGLGRIGDSSFDAISGDMSAMFDFTLSESSLAPRVLLDPSTGEVSSVTPTSPVVEHVVTLSAKLTGPGSKQVKVSETISNAYSVSARVLTVLTGPRRVRYVVRSPLRAGSTRSTAAIKLRAKLRPGTYKIVVTISPISLPSVTGSTALKVN